MSLADNGKTFDTTDYYSTVIKLLMIPCPSRTENYIRESRESLNEFNVRAIPSRSEFHGVK